MTPAEDRYRWQVTVADAGGRPREVTIRVENGNVISSTPPGEGFYADPDEADTLSLAYQVAADHARQQRLEKRP